MNGALCEQLHASASASLSLLAGVSPKGGELLGLHAVALGSCARLAASACSVICFSRILSALSLWIVSIKLRLVLKRLPLTCAVEIVCFVFFLFQRRAG